MTAAIISGSHSFSAADAFDAFTQLNELKCAARVEMAKVDFLVVPSAAHHYTVAGGSPISQLVSNHPASTYYAWMWLARVQYLSCWLFPPVVSTGLSDRISCNTYVTMPLVISG